MKQRSIYLDDETFEELRAIAYQEHLTISEVIRRYLHRGSPVNIDKHRPVEEEGEARIRELPVAE